MASPILHPLVLSSSHNITTSQSGTIFHHVTNLFSSCCQKPCISRLPQPYPHTRSYRGILSIYLWYSKRRKGWMSAIPDTKMLCWDQFCVATTVACRQNVPTFGCWADMLLTCRQQCQPRATSSGFEWSPGCAPLGNAPRIPHRTAASAWQSKSPAIHLHLLLLSICCLHIM